MKFKEGVSGFGLQIEMRKALMYCDTLWKKFGQELVITSTVDGSHSAGSLHYYGYAFDCRINYFTEDQKKEIYERMIEELPGEYDVILHSTHIHVEYDAIKRTL